MINEIASLVYLNFYVCPKKSENQAEGKQFVFYNQSSIFVAGQNNKKKFMFLLYFIEQNVYSYLIFECDNLVLGQVCPSAWGKLSHRNKTLDTPL